MSQTVADILVAALEKIGVRQVFALIGDSLNPFADAVRRSSIEWIGVRHEEGAALAAAGQAKLTGQLTVCAGTTGPGSTHLVAGLYEAARDHAPVLAISGNMPRKFQGTDFIQTTEPNLLFRDVSLYTETISEAEQAPHVIHQAIATAYAGRGVSHLTIPQDIMDAKVSGGVPSIETLKPCPDFAATTEDIAAMQRQISLANTIAILCGNGCHGLAPELSALSDRLKAPLIHSVKAKDIMAYDAPQWIGGLGMIGTKAAYKAVMDCDLLLMIGTDYPYSEFLPNKGKVIQIDERQAVLGRRTPTMLGVVGSAGATVKLLLNSMAPKTDSSFFEKITQERHKWDKMLDKQADLARSTQHIYPQAVARTVGDLAKPNAVFVFDTGLNTLWSGNWIRQTGSQRILGSFNNAAVGTALGQANGIQITDRSRQVIALCGDGGFNMLMGEFMTAVEHKLPIKVVIYNNASFGLIELEAESVGIPAFKQGIQFTNPDFAALARACGGQGFTIKNPSELKSTLEAALNTKEPTIIDVIVANERPNLPHLDIEKIQKFTLAKVKEAIRAVTGS